MSILKAFLQVGLINGIYSALMARPERYGVRGVYIDDAAIIGGDNGILIPKLSDSDVNTFFHHGITPFPNYDVAFVDASDGYIPTLRKVYECCKRIIPGGYILIRNCNKAYKTGQGRTRRLIDEMRETNKYDVLEFNDGDGLAVVRVKAITKPKELNMRPLHAGFWVAIGILSGFAISGLFNEEKK